MEIDLSTQQFSEQVASALKVSLDTVIRTWHGIGLVIRDQMISKKGVKLDGFGSFSFTRTGIT
jgi:nucleoid DNA-binding protein